MKAVFLTVHDATSLRKVDFHFWADALTAKGFFVDFVTVGFSPITLLKRGGRKFYGPFNTWENVDSRKRRFVWCAPIHPFGTSSKSIDALTGLLFSFYAHLMPKDMINGLKDPDLFIVENGAGLMLIPILAKKFPSARFIYSVCDRIETLGYHPIILESERTALKNINLIRVPSEVMKADYINFQNIQYIPHGLDKFQFEGNILSPYTTDRNVVSVGDMLFDAETIETLALNYPSWTFHLFGKNSVLSKNMSNVVIHGEQPFNKVVPYIKFADIGLAPYRPALNAEYLSQSSMKMIQYTYCKLPILAPTFAANGRPHIAAYEPGMPSTIIEAMNRAIDYDRETIDTSMIWNWDQTVDKMLESVGLPIR